MRSLAYVGALNKRLFKTEDNPYLAQKVKLMTVIRILPIPLHFLLLDKQQKKSALDSEYLDRYQEVISGIRFRTYGAIRKLQEKCQVRYIFFILFVNQTSCKDCVRQINMLRNTKKKQTKCKGITGEWISLQMVNTERWSKGQVRL